MAEWRLGRGWTEAELEQRLENARSLARNVSDEVEEMSPERGWHHYFSEAVVAREEPGPPEEDGAFERGRLAVSNYEFSDPRIVVAHFDPEVPLLGRPMLLQMRALRVLHYLGAVIVGDVHTETKGDRTVFVYRYDTLEGHIEEGVEWFQLTKEHETGNVRFRIEAAWRPGQFPNWWSRVGFSWLGPRYQETWHRRAHRILAGHIRDATLQAPQPREGRLVHIDSDVVFKRINARDV